MNWVEEYCYPVWEHARWNLVCYRQLLRKYYRDEHKLQESWPSFREQDEHARRNRKSQDSGEEDGGDRRENGEIMGKLKLGWASRNPQREEEGVIVKVVAVVADVPRAERPRPGQVY